MRCLLKKANHMRNSHTRRLRAAERKRAQKNGTEQNIIVRVALSGALHRKAYSTRSGKQSRSLKPAVRNKPQPQVRQRLLNVERHVTRTSRYLVLLQASS